MGLFNTVFAQFSLLDAWLATILPAYACVILWAVTGSTAAMSLFWFLSPQSKIKGKKQAAKVSRDNLRSFDGNFKDLIYLSYENLKQSFSLLGLVIVPALISSLPIIIVILWIDSHYSYIAPAPGDLVRVHSVPAGIAIQILPTEYHIAKGDQTYLIWPSAQQELVFLTPPDEVAVRSDQEFLSPVLHKPQWWNYFVSNEAPYLHANAAVEKIVFDIERQHFYSGLPGWLATWEFTFIATAFIWSIFLKIVFKIE